MGPRTDQHPFAATDTPSFLDLLDRVSGDEQLDPRRKADLRSAIKTVAQWLGSDLTAMPAHPRYLRERLAGFQPAAAGVSRKRLQNVRSTIAFALDCYGLGGRRDYLAPLTPQAQALYDHLPDKYFQCRLSRLLHFISAQGIAPEQMSDAVSEQFLAALERHSAIKHVRTSHQDACRAWNKARHLIPGWPDVELAVPCYQQTWGLPWTAFPASLEAAVDAYFADPVDAGDFFSDTGRLKPLAPRTIETQKDHLRCTASALVRTGHEPSAIVDLAYLARPAHVREALTFFIDRNHGKPNSYIGAIAYTLRTASKYGAALSDGDRKEVERLHLGIERRWHLRRRQRNAGKGLRRGSRAPDIRRQRGNARTIERQSREQPDDALWWVRTVDARVLVDRDGDGIAEPWRVIAVGEPLEIVSAVEDPGSDTIVCGSPFPRPHRVIREGIVERTTDLQDIGTSIIRRSLDNFARSINPKPVVAGGGETTMDDLLSWFGDVVELPLNGRIDWLQVPFNAQHALPLLQFFGERRTLRTGISPAAMGLDPNALKGQTVEGAGAIVAAPQSRAEGLTREFATRILAPLYKALLRITVSYQDRPEVIRLRNEFVQIDPRSWNADMDVQVQIGTGTRQERIAALLAILAKQEQLYAAQSPLFDLKCYPQALADIAHEMGTKDDERYFPPVDDEMLQRAAQQAEQQKQQAVQQAVAVEQATAQARAFSCYLEP
jgi:hypothetical protein